MRYLLSLLMVFVGSVGPVLAQTSYPMLMSIEPVAVQAGEVSEVAVNSRYSMHGSTTVFVSGEGVTAEVITDMTFPPDKDPPKLQKINLRITASEDAQLGVRDLRLLTPRGTSTLGQLVVVRDPVVYEIAKNNTAAEAQEVTLPATICGRIERAEDVDFFRFTGKAGARLVFHVRCMRLQDRIHDLQKHADPLIALRNASGTTIAVVDNHFAADPLMSVELPQDGEYLLEVRDVRYQGNTYWQYAIEVHDRPFVQTLFPLGVAAGQTGTVQPAGVNLPGDQTATVAAPAAVGTQVMELPLQFGDQPTNPVPVVISDLPLITESTDENNTPESAMPVSIPGGINGRISTDADIDCYRFTAKKGERFSFEVLAREFQSELDSNLRILNADGKRLTENDDLRRFRRTYADSGVENWAAPADGDYIIEIRDLHLRGGDTFPYFIKVTRAEPTFDLYLDTDKTQVFPGSCGVVFVNVVRKNGFQDAIDLAVDDMPTGMIAHCGRILPGRDSGCIVFQAHETAEPEMANVRITGSAIVGDDEEKITRVAAPYQETYQPGGGRGQWPVNWHTVAVGVAADVPRVTLSTYDISLKPGESKRIEVTLERAEGFDKNVQLDLQFRHLSRTYADPLPKGVSIDTKNSQTLLTAGATKGHITLTCAADSSPVEKQQAVVMANVSLNFVMKATYASEPLFVTVSAE
ncbi:PPC domain-containing protein [Thalassoroseus pseudoceratinae]|uniref:PPC domain-containing protein n=1 Tax=Thalassoroseus pseudoceratinae TaxID=2713176 RepID=UPI00141FC467|nr:PPC domain-containing protein [Thalassoroseus pseudoceratinae]